MTSCFSNNRPPHPKDGPWAWLVLCYSSLCGALVAGIAFAYCVILPVLMMVFDENREKTALVGSLMLGSSFFLCVITAKLCEKYGCRIVIAIGMLASTTGLVISSFSNSLYPLYLTYSILSGFGAACTLSSTNIIVRKYFRKRYSLAVGIGMAAAGMGMLTLGPFARYLIDCYGWRNTFRILAGILASLVPFCFIFDPNVEACEETEKSTEEVEDSITGERKAIKPRKVVLGFLDLSVWMFPEFTISVIGIFLGSWGHTIPLIHMIKYSEELEISSTKSSTLLVFVGIGTIVSRLISGQLCDVSFIKPRYVHQAGIILSGISTILLTFAVNYTHLIIFSVFYGIADGAFRTTTNILFINTVDIPRQASAFGQAYMIISVPNVVGPALAGMMADQAGSYTSAFYMAGSVSIVGGAVFFLHLCLFKHHTTEQENIAVTEILNTNKTDEEEMRNGPREQLTRDF